MRALHRGRLTLLVILPLMGWSIAARWSSDPTEDPSLSLEDQGQSTVTLLLDLEDDTDAETVARIEEELQAALAPFERDPWTAALSDEARLFRFQAPASELADIREALADEDDLESIEVEGWMHVPPQETLRQETLQETQVAALDDSPEPRRGTHRPNDPYYKHQWHLDQIQMPRAWQRSRGEGAVVAVIDTGVLYRNHGRHRQAPDLAQTRFVDGWDFVDGDNTPDDGHGHGTHVAGTVAQSTDNSLGVAGVAPRAAIMPIRVLDDRGAGRYGNVAAGIRWAVDHGANILNLSLGGPTASAAITNAIRYAHRKGVFVVVAAGNTGRGRVQHPARAPHAFAVGAVRFDESRSFYSSYGHHLDIAAPGGDLRVDQNRDGLPDGVLQNTMRPRQPGRHDYLAYQGTSMAAPHVAGVAALLYAEGVTDPRAIERILRDSAKDKGDSAQYGAGIVQAADALASASTVRGATSGLVAGAFALLFLGLGRKRRQAVGVALGAALLAGSAAIGLDPFRMVAATLPSVWPILLSVLLPLLLVALRGHDKRMAAPIGVIAFSLAGWLVVEAVAPYAQSGWALVTGPWLLLNAALSVRLAMSHLRPLSPDVKI